MRTSRSALRFAVRSPSGGVMPAAPCFSSGIVAEVGEHYAPVDDEAVIAAALRILSQRLVRGSVLANPRATREYLAMRLPASSTKCSRANSWTTVIASSPARSCSAAPSTGQAFIRAKS